MATHAHSTPAPTYCLGKHPRRTDHLAMVDAAGKPAATFALDATRDEIAATLARSGYVLNADDTITQEPPAPLPTRRDLAGLLGREQGA